MEGHCSFSSKPPPIALHAHPPFQPLVIPIVVQKSDPPLVSYGRRESAGYPHWSESSNYKAKSGILAIVDYAGRHLWSSAGDPDEHGVPQNVWYIKYEERVPLVSAGPFELVLSVRVCVCVVCLWIQSTPTRCTPWCMIDDPNDPTRDTQQEPTHPSQQDAKDPCLVPCPLDGRRAVITVCPAPE